MKVGVLVDITENYREKIISAKKCGFDFGQLAIWDMDFYTDENAKALKELCDEIGFKIISLWCGWAGPVKWSYPEKHYTLGLVPDWLRDRRLSELKKGGEFARKLGVDHITPHVGFFPADPNHPTNKAIVYAIRELATELKKYGQKFSFETGEELPVSLGMMMAEIGLDNVGVNFDPANLLSGGRGNPEDAMDLLGDHIFGMHAKDSIPPVFGQPNGKQMQIGEGKVNFKALITKLKEHNYNDDIVIEREIEYGPERAKQIMEGKVYLEKIIKEVYGE